MEWSTGRKLREPKFDIIDTTMELHDVLKLRTEKKMNVKNLNDF